MSRERITSIVAGAAGGAVAALAFLVIHAITIVPIWGSLASGLAIAAFAGAILGALLYEFLPPRADAIGFFLWGGLAIATFIDAATNVPEWIDIAIIIPAVVAFGGWIGYRTRGTLRGAFAGALTCVVFLMGAAGPVNTSSERGIRLFAGLLPVTLLFAAVYALVVTLTARSRGSAPLSPPA